jgi:hypothetical protein
MLSRLPASPSNWRKKTGCEYITISGINGKFFFVIGINCEKINYGYKVPLVIIKQPAFDTTGCSFLNPDGSQRMKNFSVNKEVYISKILELNVLCKHYDKITPFRATYFITV